MAIERTYVVPLRRGYINTPQYYRTNKAVSTLRKFICKHMKVKDDKIRIGQNLNILLWKHGIKNPPARVTITVSKSDEGIVQAELVGQSYKDSVKPAARDDAPQGLKEKLQAAVGGKKEPETPEVEEKPKAPAKKAAKKAATKTA
jgi:ribosomal protein L31E